MDKHHDFMIETEEVFVHLKNYESGAICWQKVDTKRQIFVA